MTHYVLSNDESIPDPPFELAEALAHQKGATLVIEAEVPPSRTRLFFDSMAMLLASADAESVQELANKFAPQPAARTDDVAEIIFNVKLQLKQALLHGCCGDDALTEWLKLLESIDWQVVCRFCHELTSQNDAYSHQGKWVCEGCWDPRLKSTE